MAFETQPAVDTVVIGNGPSALILSYILHGHIPYYRGGHHDQIIDQKLRQEPKLLRSSSNLLNHVRNSLQYSTQALPINTLLDTLFRPNGDISTSSETFIEWRYEPQNAISHVVLGSATQAGGQWIDNPIDASPDIGALSYAEQLSLPGYSFGEHWMEVKHEPMPELSRPTRRDIAEYYAAYPKAVGISDVVLTSTNAHDIYRRQQGFFIGSHNLRCNHLVLASGVFSINLPPPNFLSSLGPLSSKDGTLLVIGSGFTAADIIISTPPERKIIHIFNWDPENKPSPLKACHSTAYPEYATIYRQMKLAAMRFETTNESRTTKPKISRIKSEKVPTLLRQRNWSETYEGLPNTRILSTSANERSSSHPPLRKRHSHIRPQSPTARRGSESLEVERTATLELCGASGFSIRRTIGSFQYAVGRRGSLAYLSPPLLREVVKGARPISRRENAHLDTKLLKPAHGNLAPQYRDFALDTETKGLVALHTLRSKLEDPDAHEHCGVDCSCDLFHIRSCDPETLEVANNVFIIGSLTGDSLVRFALGGCCVVAGRLMDSKDVASCSKSDFPSKSRNEHYQVRASVV